MYVSSFFFLLALLLPPTVFLIAWLLAYRSNNDRENLSSYECGFNPIHSTRNPFSLRFFLLAIIFLVFDIEISFLLPIVPSVTTLPLHLPLLATAPFLYLVILGLLHEWREGTLDWS